MPDDDDYDQDPAEDSGLVRDLRSRLKAAEKEAAEVPGLRQENAIFNAKLGDLSPAKRKALLATHDGDPSDAEALRKTAIDLGFLSIEEPEPQVGADEQAALRRLQEATGGAEPSGGHKRTPTDEMNEADSAEAVMAIANREGILATGD